MTRRRTRASGKRRAAHRLGHWAETLCAAILLTQGYRILARRWRCPSGEIDIVARKGAVCVFVEVKARDRHESAAEAVTPWQRLRIARAAEAFMAAHPGAGPEIRFDVMTVASWRLPRHIVDAWRPER